MAYLVIEDFRLGLDRRRHILALPAGSLFELTNGHISRGGEVEKRKAFVSKYVLPPGTIGLQAAGRTLYTFGSGPDPGVPAGITYQRLAHPDGLALVELLKGTVFNNLPYTIGLFSDGRVAHFYNGVLIEDWLSGVARPSMVNNAGIAAHLAGLIDADPNYTATAVGAVITVTGPVGVDFVVTTSTVNGGTVSDQTLAVALLQSPLATVPETLSGVDIPQGSATHAQSALGTLTLFGAGGSVNTLTVAGVEIMGSATPFNVNTTQTATDVASKINAFNSTPNYTAHSLGASVTIVADGLEGTAANGRVVAATVTTMTFTTANMAGGTDFGVFSILIDSVEILGGRVNEAIGSGSVYAALLAAQINSYVSLVEYTASSVGNNLHIAGLIGTGSQPNGLIVFSKKDDGSGGVDIEDYVMAGGVDAVIGLPKKVTITVGGTFEVGDEFVITLGDAPPITFGAGRVGGQQGIVALTLKDKVYVGGGPNLFGSGIQNPMGWNAEDIGSFVTDLSGQVEHFDRILGLGSYLNHLAIFARRATQIWNIDPDPTLNSLLQALPNIGTLASKSVVGYGESDVFFLADTGVRSLRSHTISSIATQSDIGTPIDLLVQNAMQALGDAVSARAVATMDPQDGRYWLALGNLVYVFSLFSDSKISAWSVYDAGLTFTDFGVIDNRVYARSGDVVYLYGGDNNLTYDSSVLQIRLPFLSANQLATVKHFTGIDITTQSEFTVYIGTDPNQPDVDEEIAIIKGSTLGLGNVPVNGEAEAFTLRLVHDKPEAAKLIHAVVHYEPVATG